MDKPQRLIFDPTYDWHHIQQYIEQKYNIKLRGYKKEQDDVYRDFWHFIIDRCDIRRGCFFSLPEDMDATEDWQKEILTMILTEFPELATERIWVDW